MKRNLELISILFVNEQSIRIIEQVRVHGFLMVQNWYSTYLCSHHHTASQKKNSIIHRSPTPLIT